MNFKVTNIITIGLLVTLLLVRQFVVSIPWWVFAIVVWAYVSVVVWGCAIVSSGFFLPVLCRARTTERVVALSFDDGPHPVFTPQILETLQRNSIAATFFCIGKKIRNNELILRRIKDEGHIIGNHSFSHDFWFDMFGSSKMLADLQQVDEIMKNTVGVKPMLFRPPYGVTNPNVKKAIEKGQYNPIGWSVRSMDTTAKDKQKLLSHITGNLKPGDIILLHDSVEMTAAILPELILEIAKKGFKVVPLDKMLNVRAYA